MAHTIKAPFEVVRPKERADTFLTTAASMKVKFAIMKPTEKVHISILFKIMNTSDSGFRMCLMGMESKNLQMDLTTRVHLLMELRRDMDIMYANQVYTKVILREVTSMEKELLIILTIERTKENG
jgi:hypothetical protein